MPSFEIGAARPVGAIDNRLTRETRGDGQGSAKAAPSPEPVQSPVASARPGAGAPPVDSDRVAEIRKAVESGTYPVLPAKVADAMIAAGMILRTAK